ncbi:Guanine nucleotide-binding protein alpha-2 subunit [Candida maltosa Xu316]|uniref:Guanine nucleotide-binding protein alpha-2 subunit n=1 Tax=Candida maltosa (strain Xu316) TaxID=1245528 RepID=M3HS66_CANMX|nr:Guanine nucleotide-binding protein alpha-2 subunit [Candida maltosa Xu316]
MGSCASKEPTPPSKATQSTQQKRQQQSQSIQQKQQQQQQQTEEERKGSNGNLKNGSSSNESTKHPSSSSTTDHSQEKQNIQNGSTDNLITNPVDAAAQSNPSKEVKVLLLGSGESGKSTIVKQMKILHSNGYSSEELDEYRPFVYKNVLDCVKNVINAIIDLEPDLIKKPDTSETEDDLNVTDLTTENNNVASSNGSVKRKHILDYDSLNEILDYEYSMDQTINFDPSIAAKIKEIYNTPEVKDFMIHRQGEFYLIDSTDYFLSNIDRICASTNYVPSVMDVLRTRKKTSGIFDFRFDMGNGLNIHMFDVGGQRSERKKWIHCFDNVTLIIFCVALSEYDQVLLEENNQNRLEESLALFDSVVNSRWFARTAVVLFLNKIDVFAEKLQHSPLENHFPDYTGGNNINKAAKYILWRFNQVNRSGLTIYPHVTQATDTSNIKLVMAAVKETILENSLRDSGII